MLGAALGHVFDKGLKAQRASDQPFSGRQQEQTQAAFFTALFSIMGHLAKSDGRVSADEIALAEAVMDRMALTPDKRRVAMNLFNEGKRADFPLDQVIDEFNALCGRQRAIKRMFIEILLSAAFADDRLDPAENTVIEYVAKRIGFSAVEYRAAVAMITAARDFFSRHGPRGAGAAPPGPEVVNRDYTVLGIEPGATDDEVKRAYRRLMNQHHPDKLVSKGMPEEMLQVATERTREIRAAYDRIRKIRGM